LMHHIIEYIIFLDRYCICRLQVELISCINFTEFCEMDHMANLQSKLIAF